MARPRVKAIDSTEVISVRISKKTKYLLDLACRTKNLTVGRYIEEAIIDSLENIETKDKRRNLKTARDDFWADEESERFIWLIDNAKFSLSPDEERIKNIIYRFHQNNKLVFINQKGNYKEDLINYCWSEIKSFADTSDKNDDFKSPDDVYSKKYIENKKALLQKIKKYEA